MISMRSLHTSFSYCWQKIRRWANRLSGYLLDLKYIDMYCLLHAIR